MVADLHAKRRLIAILRGIPASDAADVAQAVVDCGITTIIKVPLNSPDPYLPISSMIRQVGGRTQVGAGTVLTQHQVAEVADAGATGLKPFPAGVAGIGGFAAMRDALLQETQVYVAGGAAPETFVGWLEVGATGVSLGMALYTPNLPLADIVARARNIVAAHDAAFGFGDAK